MQNIESASVIHKSYRDQYDRGRNSGYNSKRAHNVTVEIDTYPSFSQEDDLQFDYKREVSNKRVENKNRTKSVENLAKNKNRAKNSQYMTHQIHASNEYDARKYHQNIIKGKYG